MFAVLFICGNVLLRIAGKVTKNAKIRTPKYFVSHVNTFFVSLTFDRLLVTRFLKSATIKQSWLARGLFCLPEIDSLDVTSNPCFEFFPG